MYDYIWTEEEPVVGLVPPSGMPNTGCETSTHVSIYTLHLSGLRQHYRHFLRQPDGAIIEVGIFYAEFKINKKMTQNTLYAHHKNGAHTKVGLKQKCVSHKNPLTIAFNRT